MVVGPAFDDVAKKYKDDPDAATRLAKKVRSGGSGVWGQVGMPANTKISDADLARVIDWVLHGGAGGSQ
jgi:cytochrome c